MKNTPHIKSVMTPFPHKIDSEATVVEAKTMMKSSDIRHLPVIAGGKLVGMLSERDVNFVLDPDLGYSPDPTIQVKDVCSPQVYVVDVNEPLDNVAVHMAKHKIGSALVEKNGNLVGIFTVADACRCLAAFLRDEPLVNNPEPPKAA